ncbi:hypothetical protein B7494_g7246 [Chlorociboria aeruginascens]|nr:hypothetical protein B7494_g7246 [Chlorociboria aeruginascens]
MTSLLYAASRITHPSFTPENYNKWYTETHIPHILSTSIFNTATRYRSTIPSAAFPYLVLYPIKDVKEMDSEEMKTIPVENSDLFPEKGTHFDFLGFDTRVYGFLDGYGKEDSGSGKLRASFLHQRTQLMNREEKATHIITAALQPPSAMEEEFHKWYHDEHYAELAKCKGYLRSRRYRLQKTVKYGGQEVQEVPKYIAVHEFEGESFSLDDVDAAGETQWAKRMLGSMEKSEIGVWRVTGRFGAGP